MEGALPIEEIDVGDTVVAQSPVLGDLPLTSQASAPSADSVVVYLSLPPTESGGSAVDITLLRSRRWLADHRALIGGTVWIDLDEMGLHGEAMVLAIEPAPPITTGSGQLVTGTYSRVSTGLFQIAFEGLSEPVEATSAHPFHCDSCSSEWVRADDLKPGDCITTLTGCAEVQSITSLPGLHRVFNLEIEGEHVYRVSSLGLLVHNNCVHGNSKASTNPQHGYEIRRTEDGDVVKTGVSGQPRNKDGSSPRANRQTNKWNGEEGSGTYEAEVVETAPDRQTILDWERQNADRLRGEGNSMDKHKKP